MATGHDTDPKRKRFSPNMFGHIALTVVIFIIAVAAIVGGRDVLAARAEAVSAPLAAPKMPVTVRQIDIVDHYTVTRRFSGQFEARQQTALSFELPGTIAAVLVREGDTVERGQAIARLDIRLLQAERARLEALRASMEAQVELARRTNERQAALLAQGFATGQTVDDTSLNLVRMEAGIAEIDAALSSVDVNLSKAQITAPFDGMIAARMLDEGAIAGTGMPVATLVETALPRFHVGLDPATVASLKLGSFAIIQTDGRTLPAQLMGLSPSLDPMTRSRMAWFDIDSETPPPDRTTGEIVLTQEVAQQGAWIPLSALRQGPNATWTMLGVQDGIVVLEAAEIVHLEAERAFVRGTFQDGMSLIPGGTHRVVPGQSVTVSEDVAWAR